MNVRKFIAPNARDALRRVKETLGSDAIILSNRGVPGGVEIMAVAAREMAMIVPARDEAASAPVRASAPAEREDDYTVSLSSATPAPPQAPTRPPVREQAPAAMRTAPAAQDWPPKSLLQQAEAVRKPAGVAPVQHHTPVNAGIPRTGALRQLELPRQPARPAAEPARVESAVTQPAQAEVIPHAVMEEIRSLRKIVEQHLAGFAWGESSRREPVKTEVLRQMLDSGFSPQFARDMLEAVPSDLNAAQAMAWVRGAADRELLTISAESDIIDRGGVYALVGPTGVGKTTTTAKLAARCVLRHGASRVALVTTDSYRIGAHEQLRIYGRILGVPVYLVKDGAELRQTLAELQHKHVVLIDTMGMSQKDKLVPELNDMLGGCAVQRLLLLSCTSRGDTLDDVVRAYQGEGLAGCLLTKVDEAASLAAALDVIMRHRLRLHYVSNGQRVPEDLHLPNRAYLLHRAFKESGEASPHHLESIDSGLMMANSGVVAVGGARRG
ncbi:MAG TPA: flagellar biosynthesis protein FlhF [Rhodocyclaceae bacterium]|nr:flagellar biosynthesis protein FlhF [Rhodocyclaceae bacterium]